MDLHFFSVTNGDGVESSFCGKEINQMLKPKHSKTQSCAYYCSKNLLVALNTIYIFIAVILIGVTVYAKATARITSLPILGGVIACGVFLLLVAILGLIGAVRHSQVILFFYMIILVLLFIIQMSVSIGALAVNKEQQERLMAKGWHNMNHKLKAEVQELKDCCGFQNKTYVTDSDQGNLGHPSCSKLKCCSKSQSVHCSGCKTCYAELNPVVNHLLKVAGGVGLFFSFSLLLGVWMTCRYRRTKDPHANPGAFL